MDTEDKELLLDVSKRVKRLETAMLGDDQYGSTGFVNRYEKTEKQVKENKAKIEKLWIYAGAVATFAVILFELGKAFFN